MQVEQKSRRVETPASVVSDDGTKVSTETSRVLVSPETDVDAGMINVLLLFYDAIVIQDYFGRLRREVLEAGGDPGPFEHVAPRLPAHVERVLMASGLLAATAPWWEDERVSRESVGRCVEAVVKCVGEEEERRLAEVPDKQREDELLDAFHRVDNIGTFGPDIVGASAVADVLSAGESDVAPLYLYSSSRVVRQVSKFGGISVVPPELRVMVRDLLAVCPELRVADLVDVLEFRERNDALLPATSSWTAFFPYMGAQYHSGEVVGLQNGPCRRLP